MLRYLKIRRGAQKRKNGQPYAHPQIITKRHRFDDPISVENISRKRPVLIEGANSSGKTRMAQRLAANFDAIWGAKHDTIIWLGATQPLSAWSDLPALENWATNSGRQWNALKAWQKIELLPQFVRDKKTVVFLDDAHSLTGTSRKGQIARDCIAVAKCWVITCSAMNRLPPNLREVVLRRNPQTIQLSTDVAFDATNSLFWVLLFVLLAAGAMEAAVLLGALRMLGGGRWSSKQQ